MFGDYDVDGAASVALIERFLRAHGQSAATYIPDRLTEGYGPSPEALAGLAEDGARLILTVDCGTTAEAAIAAANAAGAEVIVIDHHQADEALPPAYAVLNPNRQDDLSGQGHLAAAGVVFLFLVATTRALRREGFYRERARARSARPARSRGARHGVRRGAAQRREPRLRGARGSRSCGSGTIKACARSPTPPASTRRRPATRSASSWARASMPAAGSARRASARRLLATDDEIEARGIAAKLEALNAERKAIEERMLEEAFASAEAALDADAAQPLLFLAAEGWHKGLLGLIAGRVAERFRLPTFVSSLEPDGFATGSARSIASVDLGAAVRGAVHEGLLVKGGGHAMAAGFKLERRKQDALVAFLMERLAHDPVALASTVRTLAIDGALSAGGASRELMDLLDRAGPYGPGHPEPRFVFPAHRLSRVRHLKEAHVRCTLKAPDGARIEACAFRVGDTPLAKLLLKGEGLPLHVAGHLRRTSWQGRESVELLIEDAADPRDQPGLARVLACRGKAFYMTRRDGAPPSSNGQDVRFST